MSIKKVEFLTRDIIDDFLSELNELIESRAKKIILVSSNDTPTDMHGLSLSAVKLWETYKEELRNIIVDAIPEKSEVYLRNNPTCRLWCYSCSQTLNDIKVFTGQSQILSIFCRLRVSKS